MALRARQKLGKYRIHRRLATGGFAVVYSARDTVEGIDVALKIPHDHLLSRGVLADFRKEARLAAPLDHPNILPIKTADEVEGQFAIVTRLGKETLSERLTRRLGNKTILAFAEQLLQALAFAHPPLVAPLSLDGLPNGADFIVQLAWPSPAATGGWSSART